ncbi:MAG: YhgE/Pip domain-containing protein [Eggerthellaceae bacterium]|nr:YhgE/Pip domain-containing protein [Eggerthellaceae bacterium]
MHRIKSYLRPVLAIFKRDMQRLVRVPVALIIVCGLCILPSLYAWYTIAAFWDPYHDTSSLQVAVANEDEGTFSQLTGQLNVGDEVVSKLEQNHEMGWRIVSEDDAMNGVYSGEYYAAIILPKDFSECFTSLLSGTFKQPQIDYYVNEKLTRSGVKMVDTAATDVEQQIDESFIKQVSATLIQIAQRSGVAIEGQEQAGVSQLALGVQQANQAVDDAMAVLDGLPAELDDAKGAFANANEALQALEESAPDMEASLGEAESALAEARSSLGQASASIGERAEAASAELATAASKASIQAASLAGAVRQSASDAEAALAQARRASALTDAAIAKLEPEAQANPSLASALEDLRSASATLTSAASTLSEAEGSLSGTADAMASAAGSVRDAADQAASSIRSMAYESQTLTIPKLESSMDSLGLVLGTLEGVTAQMSSASASARASIASLGTAMDSAEPTIDGAKAVLTSIKDALSSTLADLGALTSSDAFAKISGYLKLSPEDAASFLASPVQVETEEIYPVKNYGSGVAPFFTNLALWVAGFILMAMVRVKVDPEGLPAFTSRQAYLGRWLTYALFGSAQGIITGVGDLVIGVQCESPLGFVATCWITALVYVNLMYGLAFALRHIGKAIAVVLLILQVPGSSGMFPVQMLPGFYQAANPLLPFTYSIDALRECIGGFYGSAYLHSMLVLVLIFLPLGFIVGLGLGYALHNLNMMFDHKLSRTGLYTSEQVSDQKMRFRIKTVLSALLDSKAYRDEALQREVRFNRIYPKLRRIGWALLFAVPVAMMVVIIAVKGSVDTKLAMLLAFFASCVAIMAALLILNYMDFSVRAQVRAARSDDAQMADAMRQGLPPERKEDGPVDKAPLEGVTAKRKAKDGEGRS